MISVNNVFAVLTLGAIIIVVVWAYSQYYRGINEIYASVAKRYGGHSTTGGLLSRSTIRFPHRQTEVLLDSILTGGEDSVEYTRLHFNISAPKLRLEIFPESFMSKLGKLFGQQDIEIGDESFDARYVIRGNDSVEIQAILSPQVRMCIDELFKFLGNRHIYVSVTGSLLLIKKQQWLKTEQKLVHFITLGLALFDAISGHQERGIEFVATSQSLADAPEPAVCQVCGEAMRHRAVQCRSCRTPHHRDCWEYFGGCSTYGCGGKEHISAE